MLTRNRLELLLENFSKLTIGLVGDLFLDRYLMIEPGIEEMSIETDLEAHQIQEVRNYPGALGTIMNNLTALGVRRVLPVTVIGDDGHKLAARFDRACNDVLRWAESRKPDHASSSTSRSV